MNGNINIRSNQSLPEITGKPAQVWGNILIPAKGQMTVKVTGDTLQGTVKTYLEKKDTWIRIQNIDSVETQEAPIYALLGLGGSCIFFALGLLAHSFLGGLIIIGLGAALIIYAITNKNRYLAIHSHRNSIVIFMNKSPEVYQQFAMGVLALSRKLNTPSSMQTKSAQTPVQVN
ncbi:hypothetical protein H6G76_35935 [Nostoc sp. FACHB-152]|uniref:hypothetical protein n=1 Tax=Nostoc sp. FACHB-152 TaxID=2692837 RepID=UPI001689B841|nr:hypothetical protein [Nostoc sp. FACHB-152]MBD2452396.1 hypothetical protein [Nostoc sp. FACHB-152]